MDNDWWVALFYTLPRYIWIIWVEILFAPYSVLALGRSHKGYMKMQKSLTIIDRILVHRLIRHTKRAVEYQQIFVVLIYISYGLLTLYLLLYLFSPYIPMQVIDTFLIVKCYLIEVPVALFVLLNQRRPKNKVGFVWVFTANGEK